MPEFSNTVVSLFHSKRGTAPEQGGLLSGKNPSDFNPTDPLRLWIIQVGIIVTTASLLSLGLRKIRQPKVIAEVLGGILLGPTAFGRIPGFTERIFPQDSRPYLSLVANIGLCLFLFLVGLEIDSGIIKRNARLSMTVALAGMVLPFALGAALAVPLYKEFVDQSIKFEHFMLFTGVAYSITAFPVLCRILTELKLLDTTVGIVVLSAGVGNDIVGWTLLALSVALVNAGSGVTALYILLACVGWTIFLLFPVKWALRWLARRTGSTESGPTVFFMTVTILIVFGSAFFTDIIGVHAIFGAFVAGLIVPREGGLAITLTEKLEDMVSIIFLPLYFTLSGLSTDLGLLDNGITWGYTIAIMVLAFLGKFGGCTFAARYFAGFNWRESSTIGSLMSCKGLVELIVLNVGLSAGILSPRVFSMFVLEALVLTFMTTPLVTYLYPPHLRVRIAEKGANFNNVADDENGFPNSSGHARKSSGSSSSSEEGDHAMAMKRLGRMKFAVVLDKLEHLPGMMALMQLIQPPYSTPQPPLSPPSPHIPRHDVTIHEHVPQDDTNNDNATGSQQRKWTRPRKTMSLSPLRLIELSDRVSAVMKSSASPSLILSSDPMMAIFKMFASLNDLPISVTTSAGNAASPPYGPSFAAINGEREREQQQQQQEAVAAAAAAASLAIVPFDEFAITISDHARVQGADMILLNWLPPSPLLSHSTTMGDHSVGSPTSKHGHVSNNPFDALFRSAGGGGPSSSVANATSPTGGGDFGFHNTRDDDNHKSTTSGGGGLQSQFLRGVFAKAQTDVALFVDSTTSSSSSSVGFLGGGGGGSGGGRPKHIFLPFFGGPDDRLALEFLVQICENSRMTGTVVRFVKREVEAEVTVPGRTYGVGHSIGDSGGGGGGDGTNSEKVPQANLDTIASAATSMGAAGWQDTVYGRANTETRLLSDTADNIAWARYSKIPLTSTGLVSPVTSSTATTTTAAQIGTETRAAPALQRISFREIATPIPLRSAVNEARRLSQNVDLNASNRPQVTASAASAVVVVMTGRSRRLAVDTHQAELKGLMEEYGMVGSEVKRTIGDVATGFVVAGWASGGLVVVQAAANRER